MKKLVLFTLTLCGISAAQTFTGIHYTGSACYPYNVSGENNCSYVGNITGDPAAAYASITDNTGIPAVVINPRQTPPNINATGNWSGTLAWQNGMQESGSVIIASGTCTATGGLVSRYQAVYTVSCSGVDSNGNPASKYQEYVSYLETNRGGGFWQPLAMFNPYGDQPHWGSVTFVAAGSV